MYRLTPLLLLTACAFTPQLEYGCPYSLSELARADSLVRSIDYVSWRELERLPDGRPMYGKLTKEGDMTLYEGLSFRGNFEAYNHELCHGYEYNILSIEWADTVKHLGWVRL